MDLWEKHVLRGLDAEDGTEMADQKIFAQAIDKPVLIVYYGHSFQKGIIRRRPYCALFLFVPEEGLL